MFKAIIYFVLLFAANTFAQTYSAVVLDSQTKQPVPFATVTLSKYNGVMTNEEGKFSIVVGLADDNVLTINSLGYETLNVSLKNKLPEVILIKESVFQTVPVFVETQKLSADDIVKKANMAIHKLYDIGYCRATSFYRYSSKAISDRFNVEVKKSTVNNVNQQVLDSLLSSIDRQSVYLSETLSNLVFNGYEMAKQNPQKTLSILSEEKSNKIEQLQHRILTLIQNSFKKNSRLILKTGIIRLDKTEQIDSIVKEMEQNLKRQKDSMVQVDEKGMKPIDLKNLFVNKGSRVDFLNHLGRYQYIKKGYTTMGDNWVYIIEFTPKWLAKYKGRLYINSEDFGVVKAEYQSAKVVHNKIFNMFGIHANLLKVCATYLFDKIDDKYYLTYMKNQSDYQTAIERPFEVIEKNKYVKGKKRINRIKLNIDINTVESRKTEWVISNYKSVKQSDYINFKYNRDYPRTRLDHYDQTFWEGYNILTPEEAIQQIKAD